MWCTKEKRLLVNPITIDTAASIYKAIRSCICPFKLSLGHFEILSIEKKLLEQGLLIYGQNINDCDDSLFQSICTLAPCFDMSNMRKTIAKTVYNCFIWNDNKATNFLRKHMNARNIEQEQCINNSQAYILNLLLSYAYGHIEGKVLQ